MTPEISGAHAGLDPYTIFLALAGCLWVVWMDWGASVWRLSRGRVLAAATLTWAVGLLGARLLFVVKTGAPSSALWSPQAGGFSVWGGLAAAGMVGLTAMVALGLPVRRLSWVAGSGACLCLALLRVGCFLQGCCSGVPTESWWGVAPASKEGGAIAHGVGMNLHPVQLYEALFWCGAFYFWRRWGSLRCSVVVNAGFLMVAYAGFRGATGPLRADTPESWATFVPAIWLLAFVGALVVRSWQLAEAPIALRMVKRSA